MGVNKKARRMASLKPSESGLLFDRLWLFPSTLRRLGNQSLFDRGSRNADVADFTVNDGLYPLKIGHKAALGNGGDVGANAALFLGLAATPYDAALDWAFAG